MTDALVPATDPAAAAEQMTTLDVGGEVLGETLQSAVDGDGLLESGRTWCSSDPDDQLRPPLNRYPAAVDLAGCPPGDTVAVWHTHTTPDQLRNPEHSLPDIANVVFGRVDASIIPGVESDHVLVAAADREAMKQEFRQTLGADVTTTQAVADAIDEGHVSQPSIIRDRLNDAFAPLIRRVDADRPALAQIVDDLLDDSTTPDPGPICDGSHSQECDPTHPGGDTVGQPTPPAAEAEGEPRTLRSASVMRRESRVAAAGLQETLGGFDITQTVVGTTVGMFTSRLLERAVFGE